MPPLRLDSGARSQGSANRWAVLLSPKFLCDALYRASAEPERPGDLQDTHTLRKLLSHLPLGGGVNLRPAELHALGDGALETCFDSLTNHCALKLSERAG
jgi:hypothetical protein